MDEARVAERMERVVDELRTDISGIRTGRANSGLVENVMIEAYGGTQRLSVNEMASVTVADAQSIVIDPWDKSVIGEIKKGIMAANVGLNPSIDGEIIRISIPPMTSEDRQRYIRVLHAKLENGRVSIRQVRGDTMKSIKNAFERKEISEDVKLKHEKDLQELTDKYVGMIEEVGKAKEQELQQV